MTSRVWDAFLTTQDRSHVASRPVRRSGPGTQPALLMVDLYRSVFGDRPQSLMESTVRWPASCGKAGWDALPHLRSLLAEARRAGIAVVHVTGLTGLPHWREAPGATNRAQNVSEESVSGPPADQFEIVDEVAPLSGEPVIRKAAPSAFWGTPLAGYLNQLRVDTVIVAGESTSGCVRATVVDAASYRFRVLVVEDCVFDRHEAAHAINLFDMDQKYADVIGLGQAVDYLRSLTPSGPPLEVR